ncbi:MAG TPA: hypothetical protein VIR16_06590 [Candidatus Limnocylindrales bacterium]
MRLTARIPAAALAASLALAACGSSTPAPTPTPTPPPDAPTVLSGAAKATYPSKLEITLGGSYTAAGATTSLPDGLLVVDIDTAAGAGKVHLAVPASLLGAGGAATLAQLGITGDSITFDLLYDGKAVYAKSPALPALVTQLAVLAQGVTMPQVGPDTWARLLDEATLKQFAGLAAGAVASAAPSASVGPTDLKTMLDQMGGSVSLGTQTTGPGGPAYDVKLTIDPAKAQAYMAAHPEQFPTSQVQSLSAVGQLSSISADVLVDAATSRVEQVTLSMAATQSGAPVSASLKIGIAEAPAGVSFDAPANAVDLPLAKILAPLIQSMMGSGGLPIPTAAP